MAAVAPTLDDAETIATNAAPTLAVPMVMTPSGVWMVEGTRVPIATVVYWHRQGASVEQISDDYSTVTPAKAHAIIAYYLTHQLELDAYLAKQEAEAEAIWKENERRFPAPDLRQRLQSIRAARG